MLEYLNYFLEKNGFKPRNSIEVALKHLKLYNLLNETSYDLVNDKINLTDILLPYPVNWLLEVNPILNEKRKVKHKIDSEMLKTYNKYKPKLLRIYSKKLNQFGFRYTKNFINSKKITLEDIVSRAKPLYTSFLGIVYKTSSGLRVKQFIVENHEGFKHLLNNYEKVNYKIYNKNAVVLVPSKSRKIYHLVQLYNIPFNLNDPSFEVFKFYTYNTSEGKIFHDISNFRTYHLIDFHDVAALLKIVKEEWNKNRIWYLPVLIPDDKLREIVELTEKTIVYDNFQKRYRFLNKMERELIVSINFIRKDYTLISNLKQHNLRHYLNTNEQK